MDITFTLTPVEIDALVLAFPSLAPDAALHAVLEPLTAKMSEARLQRLATLYRTLSAEDQLEATTLLGAWRESKTPKPAPPVVDAPAPAPSKQGQ